MFLRTTSAAWPKTPALFRGQFTAIDDCTRFRVLRVYDRCMQTTAIRFVDVVLARLPFRIETVQTDNGAESCQVSTTTCSTAASATCTSGSRPPKVNTDWLHHP